MPASQMRGVSIVIDIPKNRSVFGKERWPGI